MFDLNSLVRSNILSLEPYSSARDDFKGTEGIFLDANENPFGMLNRYPDPDQVRVKQQVCTIKNIPVQNIFLGNGSDEIIDLCLRVFCNPGRDKILTFAPTYGMYEVSAGINDIEVLKEPLDSNFQINPDSLQKHFNDQHIKIIIICSPNNPTGNIIDNIDYILQNFRGIVMVDEAYIDFCPDATVASKLNAYPNLIVLQTLSKGWGLASVRIGMLFAGVSIIALLNKIKPPYNISAANQDIALNTLNQTDIYRHRIDTILKERKKLIKLLGSLPIVSKIYPSQANFLLVKFADASAVYDYLVQKSVIVRNRSQVIDNCLRITIGTPKENEVLIQELEKINI